MNKCYNRLIDVWGYQLHENLSMPPQGMPDGYTGLFGFLTSSFALWGGSTTAPKVSSTGIQLSMASLDTNSYFWYYDIEYFINRSANKIVSPFVNKIANMQDYGNNGVLTDLGRGLIANVFRIQYCYNWNKLIVALASKYNPIHNYDMTENTTINGTDNTELTHGKKTINELVRNDSGNANVYGFNSSSAVPASTASSDTDSTNTETNSGTDTTNNTTQQTTRLTRSGNIGVTTSQQMLESEIELRKHNILDIIFKDIDSILTIPIY